VTFLTLLLLFKIAFTTLTASLPLLVAPGTWLQARMKFGADALPVARLYGVAVTALLVGYAGGIAPAQAGVFPWSVVLMGIVSNAGATITLFVTGGWRVTVSSPIVYGAIALALIAAGLWPAVALTRVF
jgi:hypothetical protein